MFCKESVRSDQVAVKEITALVDATRILAEINSNSIVDVDLSNSERFLCWVMISTECSNRRPRFGNHDSVVVKEHYQSRDIESLHHIDGMIQQWFAVMAVIRDFVVAGFTR